MAEMKDHPNAKALIWVGSLAAAAMAIIAFSGRIHGAMAGHVDRFFISTAEAQALTADVKKAVDTATKAVDLATETSEDLRRYLQRQELKEERALLDTLKGELADTELWESTNGANALSRARKADLVRRIDDAVARIRCREIPGGPGC